MLSDYNIEYHALDAAEQLYEYIYLTNLIESYLEKKQHYEIVKSLEFDNFIKANYLTSREINQNKEKSRENLKTLINISVALVAIISMLINLFIFLEYNNEREIVIKEDKSKTIPMDVRIVNDLPAQLDTNINSNQKQEIKRSTK